MNNHDLENKKSIWYFFSAIRTLFRLLDQETKPIIAFIFLVVLIELLQILFSFSLKMVFDEIARNYDFIRNGKVITETPIYKIIFFLVSVKLLHVFLSKMIFEKHLTRYLVKLENTWPVKSLQRLLIFSPSFHNQEHTAAKADAIHRGTAAIADIVEHLIRNLLVAFLFLVAHCSIMLWLDYRLAFLYFLPMVPAAMFMLMRYRSFVPLWENWEISKGKAATLFYQTLTNIRTVQNYNQEKYELNLLQQQHDQMIQIENSINDQLRNSHFMVNGALALSYAVTLAVGSVFVLEGKTSVGNLVFLISLGGVANQMLWQMILAYTASFKGLISVMGLNCYFETQPEIENNTGQSLNPQEGDLVVVNLIFQYKDQPHPTLKNLNLRIPRGNIVGIVGESGGGKSSILKLLNRSLVGASGSILLNKVPIENFNIKDLRQTFAVVEQEVEIFTGTLLRNLTYGFTDANRNQIDNALKASGLNLKDHKRFPLGLDTIVGERGLMLSGGERQRIGLARAYLAVERGAKILLLDEATSQLDAATEEFIRSQLYSLAKAKGLTVVMIAHRLISIRECDLIYVVGQGRVLECGKHSDLIAAQGDYARLINLSSLE
jgi:ABC-type multidrug transport system fused ATPase/permease subunit